MSDQGDRARQRFRTLAAETSIAIEVEDLARIAKNYASQGLYDEALHLYEMACKLNPGSVSLRINLANARDQKRAVESIRHQAVRDELAADRSRDEVDAAQYIGLADFYARKDQTSKAIELLEIAKLKTPGSERPYAVLAKLYYGQGEWELAHEEAGHARKANPFDRDLAELSGRISFELKQFDAALENFIDAFLLSTDQKGERTEPIRRMINTLRRMLGLESRALNARIKQRVAHLEDCTERLEFRKEHLFRPESRASLVPILRKVERDVEKRENFIHVAGQLRSLEIFRHMRDEQVFRLARFVRLVEIAEGEYLFRDGERSMDFYVVHDGGIEVRKETPWGPLVLAAITPGQILGEMNFIDRMQRSTDAVATQHTTFWSFSFSALDQMMDDEKEIAVALHWAFWGSLAEKVRSANEQLKSFFADEERKGGPGRPEITPAAEEIKIQSTEKVNLFRERGLSATEMKLLATFSTEERFRADTTIFREGDAGDKLYIILEGRIRISKFIPGVGEEALAVLDRGDFFGEMALIDDKPRSADARAHERDATVLSIDRATLNEILSMDPHASLQFLNLLCRLISRRLREINDKIVQWKYMAGAF